MKRWRVWERTRVCRVWESKGAATWRAYMAWRKAGRRSGAVQRQYRLRRSLRALALAKRGIRKSCGRQGRLKAMKLVTSFRVANIIRAESSLGRLTPTSVATHV